MFDPQAMFDINRAVLRSIEGLKLSFSASRLYSYLYITRKIFGQSFEVTYEEIAIAINCKIKGFKILKELSEFNLIKKYPNATLTGLKILLFPPLPFLFLRATIRISDFSHDLIPVKNVYLIQENFKKLNLKYGLIYLGSNHLYEELLQKLEVGNNIYFVAKESVPLQDGTCELEKIFNLLIDTGEINHG